MTASGPDRVYQARCDGDTGLPNTGFLVAETSLDERRASICRARRSAEKNEHNYPEVL